MISQKLRRITTLSSDCPPTPHKAGCCTALPPKTLAQRLLPPSQRGDAWEEREPVLGAILPCAPETLLSKALPRPSIRGRCPSSGRGSPISLRQRRGGWPGSWTPFPAEGSFPIPWRITSAPGCHRSGAHRHQGLSRALKARLGKRARPEWTARLGRGTRLWRRARPGQ